MVSFNSHVLLPGRRQIVDIGHRRPRHCSLATSHGVEIHTSQHLLCRASMSALTVTGHADSHEIRRRPMALRVTTRRQTDMPTTVGPETASASRGTNGVGRPLLPDTDRWKRRGGLAIMGQKKTLRPHIVL